MNILKSFLLTTMVVGSLLSCDVPDITPEDIELDEIPTAVPLGNVTFDEVGEFIQLDDYQGTIPQISVALQNGIVTPQGVLVNIPVRQTDIPLALDPDPNFSLEEVVLDKGTLTFELRFNIPSQTTLQFEVPDILDASGRPYKAVRVLPKTQDYLTNPLVIRADVSGFRIKPQANKLRVITSGTVLVVAGDVIKNVEIQSVIKLTSLGFSSIKGFFGRKEFAIDPEVLPVSDQFSGPVTVGTSNKVLKLHVENSFGVPFALDLSQVKAIKKNNSTISLNFTGNKIVRSGEIVGNTMKPVTSLLELNSSNSNISQFFGPDVKEISFGVKVLSNPGTNTTGSNLVTKDGKIKVGIGVLVPLKITPGA